MPELTVLLRRVRRLLATHRRLLSAALAAIAALAVVEVAAPGAPPTDSVVVAAHDLSAGERLTPGDVRLLGVPPDVVPDDAATTKAHVIDSVVAGPMHAGEMLTDTRLLGAGLLRGYPARVVAAPVRISDAATVALLGLGDRIDVYAASRNTTYAKRVVAGARVVSLPQATADSATGALVVLAVSSTQAAALAQASATAPLSLTVLP
jgi:Flp pilus assembly protein CpaB